jgi:predicted TIM-barrel fold metal-dependent hydrolase
VRQALSSALMVPRMMAGGMRSDTLPERGGPAGSDLGMLQKQHLDPVNVEFGLLMALSKGGMEERNPAFAAAMSCATNDWQVDRWIRQEPRLRAGIVVPQEFPEAAVAEIERCAGDRRYVQIMISSRPSEPLGHPRYWPIYKAAERAGLPIGLHPVGYNGGHPSTGSGWPTFYLQEHYVFTACMEAIATSLIVGGVFERFPGLKIVMVEGGFAWAPALAWRLDGHFDKFRKEVPHLKRRPSEYLREHFWWTTQPIEEPEQSRHLVEIIDWIGWDRLLYSSDYPHWDYDNPSFAFKFPMTEEQRRKIFRDNALALYRLA